MDNSSLTVIVGAIVSMFGASATIVTAVWSRRKINADARKINADADAVNAQTALSMIEPLKRRLDELEKDNVTLRVELGKEKVERLQESAVMQKQISERDNTIVTMQSRIARLEGQVTMLGGTPVP